MKWEDKQQASGQESRRPSVSCRLEFRGGFLAGDLRFGLLGLLGPLAMPAVG